MKNPQMIPAAHQGFSIKLLRLCIPSEQKNRRMPDDQCATRDGIRILQAGSSPYLVMEILSRETMYQVEALTGKLQQDMRLSGL